METTKISPLLILDSSPGQISDLYRKKNSDEYFVRVYTPFGKPGFTILVDIAKYKMYKIGYHEISKHTLKRFKKVKRSKIDRINNFIENERIKKIMRDMGYGKN